MRSFLKSMLVGWVICCHSLTWANQTEIETHFGFRDTLHPETLHELELLPWNQEEREQISRILKWVDGEAPGFLKQVVRYGPVSLYRTRKDQPGYMSQPAYADYRYVAFFDVEDTPFFQQTMIHELVHVADPAMRLANTAAWRTLIEPRIEQVKAWLRDNGVHKSLAEPWEPDEAGKAFLKSVGLPGFYSASSPAEALADITAAIIVGDEAYAPPDDIAHFIREHLLLPEVSSDPVTEHYYQARWLFFAAGNTEEALETLNRAIEMDPGFAQLYHLRAQIYRYSPELPEARERALADSRQALALLTPHDQNRRLWFFDEYLQALELNGNYPAMLAVCDTVNRELPPEHRGSRDYMPYKICGKARFFNRDFEGAIVAYEKTIQLSPALQQAVQHDLDFARRQQSGTRVQAERSDYDKLFFRLTRGMAEDGMPGAMCLLGSMYYQGTVVEKDDLEALKWIRRADPRNCPEAGYYLGDFYEQGFGIEADFPLAYYWYLQAAMQGHSESQYWLASHYQEDNPQEAITWLEKAAVQGHLLAQYQLGLLYANDAEKQVDACQWLYLALSNPESLDTDRRRQAEQALDSLESVMLPEQIAKARFQAEALRTGNRQP